MLRLAVIVMALTMLMSAGAAVAAPCGWRAGEVLLVEGSVRSGGLDGTVQRRVEIGRGRVFEN
jgi:hypothetical protein